MKNDTLYYHTPNDIKRELGHRPAYRDNEHSNMSEIIHQYDLESFQTIQLSSFLQACMPVLSRETGGGRGADETLNLFDFARIGVEGKMQQQGKKANSTSLFLCYGICSQALCLCGLLLEMLFIYGHARLQLTCQKHMMCTWVEEGIFRDWETAHFLLGAHASFPEVPKLSFSHL